MLTGLLSSDCHCCQCHLRAAEKKQLPTQFGLSAQKLCNVSRIRCAPRSSHLSLPCCKHAHPNPTPCIVGPSTSSMRTTPYAVLELPNNATKEQVRLPARGPGGSRRAWCMVSCGHAEGCCMEQQGITAVFCWCRGAQGQAMSTGAQGQAQATGQMQEEQGMRSGTRLMRV